MRYGFNLDDLDWLIMLDFCTERSHKMMMRELFEKNRASEQTVRNRVKKLVEHKFLVRVNRYVYRILPERMDDVIEYARLSTRLRSVDNGVPRQNNEELRA